MNPARQKRQLPNQDRHHHPPSPSHPPLRTQNCGRITPPFHSQKIDMAMHGPVPVLFRASASRSVLTSMATGSTASAMELTSGVARSRMPGSSWQERLLVAGQARMVRACLAHSAGREKGVRRFRVIKERAEEDTLRVAPRGGRPRRSES